MAKLRSGYMISIASIKRAYTRLNYAGNDIRNTVRSVIGIKAAHVFQSDLNPVIFANIYSSREEARDSNADFFSQDIVGLRAGGQLGFNSEWQVFIS